MRLSVVSKQDFAPFATPSRNSALDWRRTHDDARDWPGKTVAGEGGWATGLSTACDLPGREQAAGGVSCEGGESPPNSVTPLQETV
eukprot:gene24076-biopygen7369